MQFNEIVPSPWFANAAEEAARSHAGTFRDSKIGKIARYGKAGFAQLERAYEGR